MLNLPAFRFQYRYPDSHLQPGITVPITLVRGSALVDLVAKVDPGSEFCLFERSVGEELGLPVESGTARRFASLGGVVSGHGHTVLIETFGFRLNPEEAAALRLVSLSERN